MRPLVNYALVELDASPYNNIDVTAKKYDSTQTGILVEFGPNMKQEDRDILIGKRVYWKSMKDLDATFDNNGKKVAFIHVDDLVGYDES
jgi:hypothetical protein